MVYEYQVDTQVPRNFDLVLSSGYRVRSAPWNPPTRRIRPPRKISSLQQFTRFISQFAKMTSEREKSINSAIEDLKNGKFNSVRAASTAYKLPRTTLRDRLAGATNRNASHEHQQRLTPAQEDFLVDWILEQDLQGFPPSHARVREMASQILRMNGDIIPLGKDWVTGFRKRNPKVSSCIGKQIDARRIDGTQPEQIQKFYNLFDNTQTRFNIATKNIWNMDEHGIALGVCTNSTVLAEAGKKKTYVKAPENREWVSVVEASSADGQSIQPLVIFKGKYPQSSWFEAGEVSDWEYTTSENGWTSNGIGLNWLKVIFLPETAPRDGGHRMLVMDGHGSHIAIDFLWLCKQHDVQLVFLPPYSSYLLQPLDLAVFSSMKAHYCSAIAELSYLDDAAPVKKRQFVKAYSEACTKALELCEVRNGWKAAGLVLWNPAKGLNSSQIQLQHSKTPPNMNPPPNKATDPLLSTP